MTYLILHEGRPVHRKVRNVMIAGGGGLAYYLARQLEDTGVKAKIISDKQKCLELSELLLHTDH